MRWEYSGYFAQGLCTIIEVLENRWAYPELLPYKRVALDQLWDKINFFKSQVVPAVQLFWESDNSVKFFELKTELECLLA